MKLTSQLFNSLIRNSSSLLDTNSKLLSDPSGPQSAARARARQLPDGRQKAKTSRLPTNAAPTDAAEIYKLGRRALPAFPSPELLKPATVPNPPLLFPDSGYEERARMLGSAYRGALESRWGVRSFAFTQRSPTEWKAFRLMCDAADRLEALEIAPAAWTLFSMDSWKRLNVTNGPPKPSWVYSLKRMRERMGFFEEEAAAYTGGQIVYGPAHLDLARVWWEMWREILRIRPTTREELLEAVEHHFPGMEYENRLQNAQSENRRLQVEIDMASANGVVLW